MSTEELTTFIFLSKVKNFTLAAEKLRIAQSTVTNRIGELEKELGKKVGRGVFGAHMDYEIHNDGPVTILMDSDVLKKK